MKIKKGYKHTELGIIPEDWEIKRLGDFFIYEQPTNYIVSSTEYNDNYDIPVLTAGKSFILGYTNEQNGIFRNIPVVIFDDFTTTSKFVNFPFKVKSSAMKILKKRHLAVNIRFIFELMQNINYPLGNHKRHWIGEYQNLKIPIPPLSEQNAIAEVLSDTDNLIQAIKQKIAKKRAIKQGAMQQLLTPQKDWTVKKLGEICSITKGQLITLDTKIEGHIPVIAGGTQPAYYHNKANRSGNTITVSASGANAGFVAFYISPIFASDCLTIGENKNYVVKFIYYFLRSIQMGIYKRQVGGAQPHVYSNQLKNIAIPIPPLPEQSRIATILSDMDAEIAQLQQNMLKYTQIKQGLMQNLLTGTIRLAQPAITNEKESISIAADPERVYKKQRTHNTHMDDAVLIGTMAEKFGNKQFPLTRFKYTKVSYLLKRYKGEDISDYLKKVAGPYNPKTRYGGAEKIALKNNYARRHKTSANGKEYKGLISGDNVQQAIGYFEDWYGKDALEWIQQFKYEKGDQLELWTTVDMAMEDLKRDEKPVNVESIKELINTYEEWQPKLKRSIFSDESIKNAINTVNKWFT